MPLINFGSILNFAEELETGDLKFYQAAAQSPSGGPLKDLLAQFAKDARKNIQTVERTRRENVTEMILEQISDFSRAPFLIEYGDAAKMSADEIQTSVKRLEERALRYYREAAIK
jgi:hypothetical protein